MLKVTTNTVLKSLAIVACLLATACSGGTDEDLATMDLGGDSAPTINTASDDGPCTDGYVRECTIELPEQDGVKNCVTGLQACNAGGWGDCQDPDDMDVDTLAEFRVDAAD